MKKKIFSIAGVAVFAVAVALNVNASISNGIDNAVTLANIEALANGEGNSGDCPSAPGRYCGGGTTICCWAHTTILHKGNN